MILGAGELASIIDDFYAAALDPSGWDTALRHVMKVFKGAQATLELHHRTTGEAIFVQGINVGDQQMQSYVDHFARVCPRLGPASTTPEGAAFYDRLFYQERDMARCEFYQDFLRPHGLKYVAGLTLINVPDRLGVMGIHRSPRAGHVDQEEADTLVSLMPHLRRALELTARLAGAAADAAELEEALSRLATGVIVVDAGLRVGFMNDAARVGLSRAGLEVRDDELHCRAQRKLRDVVRRAVELRSGRQCAVIEGPDNQPVVLTVCPLPSPAAMRSIFAADSTPPRRALVVFDSPVGIRFVGSLLCDAYGLTVAESDVALAIVEGHSLREIATKRGVTFNTVRTQAARARSKLGCRTLAELVRRVFGLGHTVVG